MRENKFKRDHMMQRLDVFIKMAMAQGQGYMRAVHISEPVCAQGATLQKALWRCEMRLN
jgi:hypothetical protein